MSIRSVEFLFLFWFKRSLRGPILLCALWHCNALKLKLFDIITYVLMPRTIDRIISCWKRLWCRQILVRERERERECRARFAHFCEGVVTSVGLSFRRVIITVMMPYFMMLSVMLKRTPNLQKPLDFPVWGYVTPSSTSQHVAPLLLFSLSDDDLQLFLSCLNTLKGT
jgi:hypothetical protein